jgi:hypothetical protein
MHNRLVRWNVPVLFFETRAGYMFYRQGRFPRNLDGRLTAT